MNIQKKRNDKDSEVKDDQISHESHNKRSDSTSIRSLTDVQAAEADMVRRNEQPQQPEGSTLVIADESKRIDGTITGPLSSETPIQVGTTPRQDPTSITNPTNIGINDQVIVPSVSRDAERQRVFEASIVSRPLIARAEPYQPMSWETSLKLYSAYVGNQNPVQFVVYDARDPVIEEPTDMRLFAPKMDIIGESINLFRKNIPLITKDYNTQFLSPLGLTSVNGTLFTSNETFLIPIIPKNTIPLLTNGNRYGNIEAELTLIVYMLTFNQILVHRNSDTLPNEFRVEFPVFIGDQVILPVGPALPLAATALGINAVSEYANMVMDGDFGTFMLGRVNPQYDAIYHHKVGHTENKNIDKYTAEFLNINFVGLLQGRTQVEEIQNRLLACCWEGSEVHLPLDYEFAPFESTSRDRQLAALALMFARLPTTQQMLLDASITYLMECSLFELTTTPRFIAKSVETRSNVTVLRNGLHKLYGASNLNDVYRLLAGEVVPWIQIPYFKPLAMDTDVPTCVITVFIYMIMQVLLPNQFWMYCRIISNELVKYFTIRYPTQMAVLLSNYGYRLTPDMNGVLVPSPNNSSPFPHDSIFSEDFPILFHQVWRADPRLNILRTYMEFFDPFANNVFPDNQAINSHFPRLQANPTHVIGTVPFQQRDALLLRVRAMAEHMKGRATKTSWNNLAASEGTGYTEQISHMTELTCDAIEALCATAHFAMRTLANLPTAIFPNLVPPYQTPSNANWAIFSQNTWQGQSEPLRRYCDSETWDASSVLLLISNTDFTYNSAKGKGLDKVVLPSTLQMPNPIATYGKQIMMINMARNMAIPDATVELILFRTNPIQAIQEVRDEWELVPSSRVAKQLSSICKRVFKVAPEWLKGFSPMTSEVSRDGRMSDPIIRRTNRAAQQLPYDPVTDSGDIENVLEFLNDVEHERLDLTLKMIRQMKFIRQGVRLMSQNRVSPTHLPVEVPDNYVEVEYSRTLTFVTRRNGHQNMRAFVRPDGEIEFDPFNWGLIHLTVNAPIINIKDIEAIEAGIRDSRWIVTLTFVKYVPQIVSNSIPSMPTLYDLCVQKEYDLRVLSFFYNQIIPESSRFAEAVSGIVQRIFPLQDVIDKRVVGGLASTAVLDEEVHLELPDFSEYDTGEIDANGYIRHSDGILKRDIRSVSMSNPVSGVHAPLMIGVIDMPATIYPRDVLIE